MREGTPGAEFRAMFQPPAWATGGISTADAEFLAALVAQHQPEIVLEIGVAAGTSSAALLYALDQLPDLTPRILISVDVRATCYFDRRYATGAAACEMYPTPRSRWILHLDSDARRIRRALPQGAPAPDLIFIDGNHSHPWPLLDCLHLAPWARPEAWIALHDLALPRLYPQFQTYGPAWLFAAWPGETIAGTGAAENIGAVRLPADLRDLLPVAQQLIQAHAWEAPVAAADVELSAVFAPLAEALRPRLRPAGGRRHV